MQQEAGVHLLELHAPGARLRAAVFACFCCCFCRCFCCCFPCSSSGSAREQTNRRASRSLPTHIVSVDVDHPRFAIADGVVKAQICSAGSKGSSLDAPECCHRGGPRAAAKHRALPRPSAGTRPAAGHTARHRRRHPCKPVRLTTVLVPELWGRAWLLAARPTVSTARQDANCSSRALTLILPAWGGSTNGHGER
jgi:hypothetical protein